MLRLQAVDIYVPSIYYTDGSGTTFDKPAGIGVFANHGNYQDFIAENIGHGTNNRAELVAIWRALRQQPSTAKPLLIFSDSEYAIGSCTKDWTPQKNADLIRDIRQDLALRTADIVFNHVPGHKNIEGNEIADKLANIGRKLVTKVTLYTP
jgi:ribonuclease HI